jgi:GDP-D-mannose dehydratase
MIPRQNDREGQMDANGHRRCRRAHITTEAMVVEVDPRYFRPTEVDCSAR